MKTMKYIFACLIISIFAETANSQTTINRSGVTIFKPSTSLQKISTVSPKSTGVSITNIKVNQDNSGEPQNETTIAINPTNYSSLVAGAND